MPTEDEMKEEGQEQPSWEGANEGYVDCHGANPFVMKRRALNFLFAGALVRVLSGQAGAELPKFSKPPRFQDVYDGTTIKLPTTYDDILDALNNPVGSPRMTNPDDLYNACFILNKKNPGPTEEQKKALVGRLAELRLGALKEKASGGTDPKILREERELMRKREEVVRSFNKGSTKSSNWIKGTDSTDDLRVIPSGRGFSIEFVESHKGEGRPKRQSTFSYETALPKGRYKFSIRGTATPEVYLYNRGQSIDQNGKSIPQGAGRKCADLTEGSILSVPENCTNIIFVCRVTFVDRAAKLEGFEVQDITSSTSKTEIAQSSR